MPRLRRVFGAVIPAVLVLGSVVVGLSGAASAAGPATIVASQSTGLADGQTISVSGTGYSATSTVVVVECNDDPNQPTVPLGPTAVGVSCSAPGSLTNSDGSGDVNNDPFTVYTGVLGPPSTDSPLDSAGNDPSTDAALYPCPPTAAQEALGDTCELGLGDSNGDAAQEPISFAPLSPVVSVASPSQATAGDPVTFSATVTQPTTAPAGVPGPTGTVSWSLSGPGSPTCVDSTLSSGSATCTVPLSTEGDYIATATYSGDGNYASGSSTGSGTQVGNPDLTDQSVSFTSTTPGAAIVGGTYTPTAAATSGLTPVITVDPSSSGACSIDGSGVVTFEAPGTCTLDANQAGDDSFNPAPQAQQSFTVSPALLPHVSSIAPAAGLSTGGTSVVISGTNLAGVSAVDFGTNPAASITSDSSTSVTAVSPAGTGSVDVTVTSLGGTSPLVPADTFTYVAQSPGAVSCVVTDIADGSTTNGSLAAGSGNAVTGVHVGDHINWVCSGLNPSQTVGLIEASPLLTMDPANQGVSQTGTNGDILGYADLSAANLSITASSQGVIDASVTAVPSFRSNTPPNPTIDCPPTQAEANLGAIGCTATLFDLTSETALSTVTLDYAGQPAPQTPFLALAGGSGVSPGGATLVPQTPSGSWWGAGVAGAGTQGTDPLTVTVTDPSGNPVPGVFNNLGVPPASYTLGQAAPAPLQLTGTVQLPSSVVTDGAYRLTVSEPNLVSPSPATIVASVRFSVTSPGTDQSVSFLSSAPSGAIVGDTYTPSAAATSGLTPVITVDPSSVGACSIDDSGVVTLLAAGTCTLDADQAGNDTFNAAPQVQQSFTVNPAPTPQITSIAPATGLSTGGTSVVISGTNLAGVSAVDFGTNPASITSDSSTSVTAIAPAGTGSVDVTVTSGSGTSPLVPADIFTYVPQSSGGVSCVVTDPVSGSTVNGSPPSTTIDIAVTGVSAGDHLSWVCSGLSPSEPVALVEASPLAADDTPNNQFSYSDIGGANLSITASAQGIIDTSLTASGSFGSPPNTVDCPPTQAEANLGAIGCTAVLVDLDTEAELSAVTLDYANQAAPQTPQLSLAGGSDVSPGGATLVPQNLSGSWWGAGAAGAGARGTDPLTVTVTDPSGNPVPGVSNNLGVPAASYALGQAAPAPLQLTGTVQLPSPVVTDGAYQLTVSEPNLVSASPATIVASVPFSVTTQSTSDQSVSFTSSAPSVAIVGGTYSPTAAATSGLTPVITVDPSSSGACSIDGSGVVTLLAAGTCTLDANQAGDDGFNPAPQVQQSFTVSPVPTPQVTSIAPVAGSSTGGTSVVISGTNLDGLSAVDFGTNPAASITSDSATSVTAVSPAGTGSVDVTVTNGGGTSPLVPDDTFTYVPQSSGAVSCVVTDPGSGSTVNGSAPSATIDNAVTGVSAGDHLSWVCIGLSPAEQVALVEASPLADDDSPINEPAYSDIGKANLSITASAQGVIDTSLTASGSFGSPPNIVDCPPTPAEANLGAIGCTAVLVDIDTDAELSVVTLDYADQASPAAPQLALAGGSDVSPGATLVPQTPSGSWWGAGSAGAGARGTDPLTVTVTDPSGNPVPGVSNNLGVPAASYTLGQTAPAPLQLTGTVQLPNSVVTDGAYQLTVSEPNLVSASPATITASVSFSVTTQSTSDQSISFTSGAPSAAIVGGSYTPTATATSGLTPVITIDPSSLGACSIDDSGVVTFVAPGTCTLDANQAGNDTFNPAPQVQQSFTVSPVPTPQVTSVAPVAGPTSGGTSVVISGTNLAGLSGVEFGTNPAASITSDSSTSVTAIAPAGTGSVDITVTNAGGTSPLVPADTFTYVPQSSGAVSCVVTDTTDGSTVNASPPSATIDNAVSGVHAGDHLNWVCIGLNPSQSVGLIEASPLLTLDPANHGLALNGTNGDVLAYADIAGANLSITASPQGVIDASMTVAGSFQSGTSPFPLIDCPPTQAEANLGAIGCTISLFDIASENALAATTLDFSNQATPQTPQLSLAGGSTVSPVGATLSLQTIFGSWWGAGAAGAGDQGSDPLTVTVTDQFGNPVTGVSNALGVPAASYTFGQTATPSPLQLTGTVQLPQFPLAPGSYFLTVSEPNLVSSSPATITASVSFLVTQPAQGQSVSFTSTAPSAAMVGGTYAPTAAATSGLTPVITVDPSSLGACSIDGSGVVSFLAAGTCTLDANQAGNATFSPAAQVQQSFTVNPANQAPVFTSAATANAAVGQSLSFTVMTTGFPIAALTSTGTLPSGVTFTNNGNGTATLAGTPTGTVKTYSLKFTAKNTVGTTTQTFSLVLGQLPAITSATTTTFTAGKAGTFKVTTTGSPTAALTSAGALPSGVTFVDNGNGTATLAGSAGASGTYPLTITATNANGTVNQTFSLVVNSLPAVTSPATASAIVGQALRFAVTTSGSPTPALTLSGTPPSGVSLVDNGDGTGTLTGTPTGAAKTYVFTITAKNAAGTVNQSFSLVVTQAPAITSATTTTFTAGKAGTFKVTTTGSPAAALTSVGALPGGVTFVDNGNGTATLAGSAGASGTYPLTITAANAAGATSQSFSLVVNSVPAVTSPATATAIVGQSLSFTVTTSGSPTPALTLSGTPPSGVSLVDNGDGTGTLTGIPGAGTAKTYALTITAKNSAGTATQSFSLVVTQAPAITSAMTTTFTAGKAGTFKVTTTGSPAPALTSAGALPGGVTFVDNGNGTATLAGSAGASGTYPLTITAANAAGATTQSFSLVVNSVPAVTSLATATAIVGQSLSFTVTTSGSPTPALTLTGTPPSGVSLVDNGDGTGTLTGIPAAGTAKTYTLKITAKNAAGSVTQSFSLVVTQAPAITSAGTTTFTAGKAGTFKVTTTGSPAAALTSVGALPTGVTFVDNGNGTATLAGSAGASGTYPLTITAANAAGATSQSFSLVVNSVPAVTSPATTNATIGQALNFTVTTTGSPTPVLTVSGTLPPGVTFVDNGNSTATLSGTPTGTAKTYALKITAKNAAGSVTQSFSLVVGH